MVDGVLASCYASFDHDLPHFVMTPVQWFPGMMDFIFGCNHGIQGYTRIAKLVGRYVIPNNYLHVRSDFDKQTYSNKLKYRRQIQKSKYNM